VGSVGKGGGADAVTMPLASQFVTVPEFYSDKTSYVFMIFRTMVTLSKTTFFQSARIPIKKTAEIALLTRYDVVRPINRASETDDGRPYLTGEVGRGSKSDSFARKFDGLGRIAHIRTIGQNASPTVSPEGVECNKSGIICKTGTAVRGVPVVPILIFSSCWR
jgi:hypothetical protein